MLQGTFNDLLYYLFLISTNETKWWSIIYVNMHLKLIFWLTINYWLTISCERMNYKIKLNASFPLVKSLSVDHILHKTNNLDQTGITRWSTKSSQHLFILNKVQLWEEGWFPSFQIKLSHSSPTVGIGWMGMARVISTFFFTFFVKLPFRFTLYRYLPTYLLLTQETSL